MCVRERERKRKRVRVRVRDRESVAKRSFLHSTTKSKISISNEI